MTETSASTAAYPESGACLYSCIVVFTLSLLACLLSFSIYPSLEMYDNGIIVSGADAVLQGKFPYRDFWTMYAPGQFYLTALLFRMFEPQLYLACLIGIVSKAIIVTSGYAALKRYIGKKWLPELGAVVLALFLVRMGNETFPTFPAAALAMQALLLMERGLAQRRLYQLFAAGLFTALAACFRHDMGFYTAVALSFGAAFISKMQPQPASWREIMRMLGAYWGGILLIGVPVAAFFLYHVPFQDFYENLIHIPSAIYPEVRRLPWVGVKQLQDTFTAMQTSKPPMYVLMMGVREFVVYVPFLVAIPALYHSAHQLWQGKKNGEAANAAQPFVLLASLLCLLMTLKGAVRPAPHHLAQSIVLAIPVGLLMAPALLKTGAAEAAEKFILAACLSLACIPLAATDFIGYDRVMGGLYKLGAENNVIDRCKNPALPRLRCMMAYYQSDRRNVMVADFLRQRTPPDAPIYIGAGRHDKIFWNSVMMYFMAERPAATKWAELHPGVQTRAETQMHMIEEMRRTPPGFLVLDTDWDTVHENNLSSKSSGIHFLDNWLRECYKEVARFESIHLMTPHPDAGERCRAPAQASKTVPPDTP